MEIIPIHLVIITMLLLGQSPCSEAQGECLMSEFRCLHSSAVSSPVNCIPGIWRCDGENDCNDGSDESGCIAVTCSASQFSCGEGMMCIPKRWLCDGDIDCPNSADERECEERTCSPGHFQCNGGGPLTCIPTQWTCDGDRDCTDGSDESEELCGAPANVFCVTNEFQCWSGECIHTAWKCDHEIDCSDGSDELPSLCQTSTTKECSMNEYRCTGGTCIPATKVCDGTQDCSDSGDEAECGSPSVCDDRIQFACFNGDCIPTVQVCDGVANCPNSEDELVEGMCDVNECDVNNGNCEQVCIDRPYGHICTCREGYSLLNGSQCVDINECNGLALGTCSQICQNRMGFYECQCEEHYDFQQIDGRGHCRSKPKFGRPQLMVARRQDIRIFDTTYFNIDFTTTFELEAIAVDYDISPKSFFWGSGSGIYKIEFVPNEIPSPSLVMPNVGIVDGIAVDWVNDLLYWTDAGLREIAVCNYEGSKKTVLFNYDLDEPRAIAVDPKSGLIFWSDWGNDPKIERAGANGEGRRIIVSGNIGWPNGIVVDYTLELLYWVDAETRSINMADFEGGKRRAIISGADQISHPFGITVFEDFIYWTDWHTNSVQRADKFTGSNQTAVITGMSVMGLTIIHPLRRPDNGDAASCSHDNGMCSHLCVAAPRVDGKASYSCLCRENVTLGLDGHTCEGDTPHIGLTPVS